MQNFLLSTGIFDVYESTSNKNYGLYKDLGGKTLGLGVGVYNIVLLAAVYISGIAFIVSAILLIINSRGSSQKLNESKKYIIRVFIVSVLIFGVTGLITLVQGMAIH